MIKMSPNGEMLKNNEIKSRVTQLNRFLAIPLVLVESTNCVTRDSISLLYIIQCITFVGTL